MRGLEFLRDFEMLNYTVVQRMKRNLVELCVWSPFLQNIRKEFDDEIFLVR